MQRSLTYPLKWLVTPRGRNLVLFTSDIRTVPDVPGFCLNPLAGGRSLNRKAAFQLAFPCSASFGKYPDQHSSDQAEGDQTQHHALAHRVLLYYFALKMGGRSGAWES